MSVLFTDIWVGYDIPHSNHLVYSVLWLKPLTAGFIDFHMLCPSHAEWFNASLRLGLFVLGYLLKESHHVYEICQEPASFQKDEENQVLCNPVVRYGEEIFCNEGVGTWEQVAQRW